MEDDHSEKLKPCDFLLNERVTRRFADINIDLLRGKHIEPSNYYAHDLLEEFFNEFAEYYENLYQLILRREKKDGVTYFYLDFPENGRGKMNNPTRFKELNEEQTVIGIVLLNMYYAKWFEHPKEIQWENIRQEIEQGEQRSHYKLLLFGEIRDHYSDLEWENVESRFNRTLISFEHLGWVTRLSHGKEEIHFHINVSINRLAELYQKEIENIDKTAERLRNREES